jgi:hypothetical protein
LGAKSYPTKPNYDDGDCCGKGGDCQGSILDSGYTVSMEVRVRGYSRIQDIIGVVYR